MVDADKSIPTDKDADTTDAPSGDVIDLDHSLSDEEVDELVGQELRFRVGSNIKFRRLDKYLGGRFSQFSRTHLQRLIKEQGVNVNGHIAKPSHKLNAGDEISLILPPKEVRELIPEDIPLNIIYEDDHMVVINKQPHLIVHPARGYKNGTLVNGLVHHFQNLSSCPDDIRPGIVHRLDKNTTGCLVVAKDDNSHWQLSRQFAERTTKKTYIAIAHGTPELDADCIDQPLGVHPTKREKYAVRYDVGKPSMTVYEVLEAFRGYSLLQLDLKTGRTHQIRVHLSYLKHPVVADDMYGGKVVYPWQIEDREATPEEPLMARCALHAWKIEINHPATDERMTFEAPLPDDMQNLLEHLRQYRKE
ncbi:MAG: RluA family pseudouridine synthase [Planctomycetota bacterium]|jgi:23S rRNA pseudouridine1911/1915/1917 synthase